MTYTLFTLFPILLFALVTLWKLKLNYDTDISQLQNRLAKVTNKPSHAHITIILTITTIITTITTITIITILIIINIITITITILIIPTIITIITITYF